MEAPMTILEALDPRAQRISGYFFAVLLAAAAVDGAASAQSIPAKASVVRIESGQVRGLEADGVVSFKGIPYAEPPVGKLRWRPPQPAKHWGGVRDATKFGQEAAGHGLDLRWRECAWTNFGLPPGRHAGEAWRRLRQHELSDEPARFLCSSGVARRDAR